MTSARERILASIRDGLLRSGLPQDAAAHAGRKTAPPETPPLAAMVEQFTAALEALSGHVHRAAGAAEAAAVIGEIARAHHATSYLGWDDAEVGCPGLADALAPYGLTRVTYELSGDPERRARDVEVLAGVGLGVTGAHAALADTGGLVLVSGPGRGRLASLLPPVHVAIVCERRLRPSLAALVREEPGLLDAGSNLVVVAGPSRTADIEMTLSHGVHGPKHVHVILTP